MNNKKTKKRQEKAMIIRLLSELNEKFGDLDNKVANISQESRNLTNDITDLKNSFVDVKSDLAKVRQDVYRMSKTISAIKAEQWSSTFDENLTGQLLRSEHINRSSSIKSTGASGQSFFESSREGQHVSANNYE